MMWSTMTRTPTPSISATGERLDLAARTPSTSTSRERTAYASICSPACATRHGARASSSRSTSVTGGSAHGELGDPQRRLTRRDRHALAVLAARTGPGVEVGADRVDEPQRLGAVADELRGAHRLGDLAVLDHVRLGDPEHEVAGGGVHLPAAERDAVEPVLGVADDRRRGRRRPARGTCSSSAPSAGAGRSRADRCRCSRGPASARGGDPTCSRQQVAGPVRTRRRWRRADPRDARPRRPHPRPGRVAPSRDRDAAGVLRGRRGGVRRRGAGVGR